MTWDVTKCIEPQVIPGLKTTVGDMGPWLKRVEVRRPFGGKASFDAEFFQYAGGPTGDEDTVSLGSVDALLQKYPAGINPFPHGGDYGVLPHNYTVTRTIAITFSVGMGEQRQTWTSPVFMPGAPHYDGEFLHWSGFDKTIMLEQANQKMDDIIADQTPPVRKMAHTVIKETCAQYGINQVTCNFKDYMVRLLRRTAGTPLEWCLHAGRPAQAVPHWREGQMIWEAAGKNNGGQSWTFIDELNIEVLSVWIDDGIKNKFTITRGEPQPGIIGEQECIGPQCLGRTVDMQLDPPSMSCQPHVEVVHGEIIEYAFFQAGVEPSRQLTGGSTGGVEVNALPAPGAGGVYLGNPPAARVKATYIPPLGLTEAGGIVTGGNAGSPTQMQWTPRYHITYFGGGQSGSSGFSNKYTFTKTDTTGTVTALGVREEYGNIEDTIIPDQVTAEAYLDAILYENVRRFWRCEARTPYFNPWIEPGDTIVIVDKLTNQPSINWFVEEIILLWEAPSAHGQAPNVSMTLMLSRGYL